MKHRVSRLVLRRLVAAATALCALPAAAADDGLSTRFVLLAGRPPAQAGAADRGVLVVPGLVIALGDAPAEPSRILAGAEEIAGLARKLESTLGLDSIEILYTHLQTVNVDRPLTLQPPAVGSPIRVEVVLQGFNDAVATYRVRFRDDASTFADSVVTVPREKRALVGGLDGAEAPYLFLVVEPQSATRHVDDSITPPRVLERTTPQYTTAARRERIEGVVILQLEIDRQGQVRKATVRKGLPEGLSDAAIESVRQWRFEPARDAAGNPIAVYYNITVHFRLEDQTPLRTP